MGAASDGDSERRAGGPVHRRRVGWCRPAALARRAGPVCVGRGRYRTTQRIAGPGVVVSPFPATVSRHLAGDRRRGNAVRLPRLPGGVRAAVFRARRCAGHPRRGRGRRVAEPRACEVFAFPSTKEGFGLAAMEALAAGRPVVARDLPVLREVFGEAVRYASDPPGFAAAMAESLGDDCRALAGRELALSMTWETAARRHVEFYKTQPAPS